MKADDNTHTPSASIYLPLYVEGAPGTGRAAVTACSFLCGTCCARGGGYVAVVQSTRL